ncbi:protein-glutamate methylesterase/protein-glutamine glutaminase [Deefgea piscis]|uniref:protein-glutamate methylesterase/protein-glutamine glutaminase n=1 Tax=Deefgea piscis TaxID=2739061 RepID=UPI001C7F3B32|nr:chemotaxis response regulator protein-glutamate methylesterase [Deefgea piscis]QZA80640.1 chemotaxis response regulator protein-glutamate methylesterase [Deefgea piscis]
MGQKIKVIVVDDSALMRSLLKEVIDTAPDMECVAAAPDPLIAREKIRELNPDVITLDVEMPKMDGLDFLARLMRLKPTPVLMISSLTEKGSEVALRALELGAVDIIAKPKLNIAQGIQDYAEEIREKIRMAAKAKVSALSQPHMAVNYTADAVLSKTVRPLMKSEKLIIVGASTGGTEALKEFLVPMPPDAPGILIAQHMPEMFTKSFANRLDTLCRITVKEAEHGERILPGHAYIAPGHSHLLLGISGANYVCELSQAPPVNRHRPSVDVLFRSAANVAGRNSIGVILTGMGKDGAVGMLEMREAGAHNFAQDEASCVVFGMPKEAIAVGGVNEIVSLKDMAHKVLSWLASNGGRALRI